MRLPSRPPDSVAADAVAEVQKLEADISALEEKNPHAQSLVEALRVARAKTKVPPVQQRIQSCKTYVERARKRVARAEAVIARTTEQKPIYEGEVAGPELQRQIDKLVRKRDLWKAAKTQIPRETQGVWCGGRHPSVKEIPLMPAGFQELSVPAAPRQLLTVHGRFSCSPTLVHTGLESGFEFCEGVPLPGVLVVLHPNHFVALKASVVAREDLGQTQSRHDASHEGRRLRPVWAGSWCG